MAEFVRLLLCLTFVPLVMGAIRKFDLRGSTSRLGVESTNFVQKTVPSSALHEELNKIRLRRDHSGIPTSNPSVLNDGYNTAVIYYSGTDQKVIFILTFTAPPGSQSSAVPALFYSSNLYRSADYGYSYELINDRLEPDDPDNLKLFGQFFISPEDNKQIVFPHYVDSVMYVTTDEGATFTKISMEEYNINPRSLVFHPTDGRTFLGFNTTDRNLYVSHDLGSSFSLVATSVVQYSWGIPGYDNDVSTIFYTSGDSFTSTYLYQTSDKSSTSALFDPNLGAITSLIISTQYMFCQRTGSYLMISYNRQPFKQAIFPAEDRIQTYLVAAIPDVMAIVITRQNNQIYNMYTSDTEGHYFSESLPDISVSSDGQYNIDLELVDSMNHTFIANQNVRADSSVTNPSQRTLISFNNAGVWEPIQPPETYYNGSLVSCEPPSCSLHFHMSTSAYARLGVYSQESAPGIIVAHGTIGEALTNNPDLFLSQDGGVTWIMTLESSWGVSVLDHGGLLVAARDYHQDQSNSLMYSCDEGGSWSSYEFLDQNLTVFGVITEPGETTTVVSLFGVQSRGGLWEVVLVNFSQIFDGVCTQPQDYYSWSPYDENFDTSCLLGASVTIERRRPGVCCLNGLDYNRELSYTPCSCTAEDFECDYGYMPGSIGSGTCVRDSLVVLDDPCVLGQETYMQSQGYRKIPGDACTDGEEELFAKVLTQCCRGVNQTSPSPYTWSVSATSPSPYTWGGNETSPSPEPAESSGLEVSTIVLGVFLLIAVMVIAVLLVSFLVVVCKLAKKRTDGYSRVERLSFHAEDSSSSLPPDTDDDDNDEEDDKLLNP